MDIKRLEYFRAIIEKGQITKAAKSLHISHPPLSQRLKVDEESLSITPAVITLESSYTNAAAQRVIDMICERF